MMPYNQMMNLIADSWPFRIHPRNIDDPQLSFQPIRTQLTAGQLNLQLPGPVQNALLHFPLNRLSAEYTCNVVGGYWNVHEERNLVIVELHSPSVHFAIDLYYEHQGTRFALWSMQWQNPFVTLETRTFNKRHGRIDPMFFIVMDEYRKLLESYRQPTHAHVNFVASAWRSASMSSPPVSQATPASMNHLNQLIMQQILMPHVIIPGAEDQNIERPQKARAAFAP